MRRPPPSEINAAPAWSGLRDTYLEDGDHVMITAFPFQQSEVVAECLKEPAAAFLDQHFVERERSADVACDARKRRGRKQESQETKQGGVIRRGAIYDRS